MKTKRILILFVVAFMSLLFSSIAFAESWVLWKKYDSFDMAFKVNRTWEIISAISDHNSCMLAQKRVWQVMKTQADEIKKHGTTSKIKEVPYNLIIITFKNPKYIRMISQELYCLPGTLDPREK